MKFNKKKLSSILKERGISEKEFAAKISASKKNPIPSRDVSCWVAGKAGLSVATLALWCDILGVTPNDFYDYRYDL